MPKFRDYFRQMLEENEELFSEFALIHRAYETDKSKNQNEFNKQGVIIVELVREWEGKLCGFSEKGEYAKYSKNLAEKFQGEVKTIFPLIDFVGVEIRAGKKMVAPASIEKKLVEEIAETDPDILEIEKLEVLDDDFKIKKLF